MDRSGSATLPTPGNRWVGFGRVLALRCAFQNFGTPSARLPDQHARPPLLRDAGRHERCGRRSSGAYSRQSCSPVCGAAWAIARSGMTPTLAIFGPTSNFMSLDHQRRRRTQLSVVSCPRTYLDLQTASTGRLDTAGATSRLCAKIPPAVTRAPAGPGPHSRSRAPVR